MHWPNNFPAVVRKHNMPPMVPRYYVTERDHWSTWFAWYPVKTIDGERIFWKKCYRRYVRYIPRYSDDKNRDGYEYANLFTIIKK